MNEAPKLVVLIPTCNEPTLETVLEIVSNQLPAGAKIVVIGFGAARQLAEKYGAMFVDTGVKTLKAIGLNRVVQKMDAERFIVLDADAIPKPGWMEAMIAAFNQGHSLFSAGVDVEYGNFWMRVYNLSMFHLYSPDKKPGIRMYLPGISFGFTKAAFQTIGLFDEKLPRSEDHEWALRAYTLGIEQYFTPDAIIVHNAIYKNTFKKVMVYWRNSGYDNWLVRLKYANILKTPAIMRYPVLVLIFSPLLALVPTLRIFITSPALILRNISLLPFVYLTKLAWCWGVFLDRKKGSLI